MEIPPLHGFDIDHLDPITIETTLTLPRISETEVRESTRLFSAVLANHAGGNAWREPQRLVEFLSRCLLSASFELVRNPSGVLACFRSRDGLPWFERECELVTPSDSGARENRHLIAKQLDDWGLESEQRDLIRSATLVIAVGSLGNIGRLPMQAYEPSEAN